MCQVNNFDDRSIYVFILLISLGFTGGLRDPEYRTPELALISYVSAEMVAAGGFIDLSIRSPIRFAARSSGSASRWA